MNARRRPEAARPDVALRHAEREDVLQLALVGVDERDRRPLAAHRAADLVQHRARQGLGLQRREDGAVDLAQELQAAGVQPQRLAAVGAAAQQKALQWDEENFARGLEAILLEK